MNGAPGPCVRQRGAAALGVTLLLVFVMALGAIAVHRGLVVEQRASLNQYAAAQAFEAAEAGLQWVQAQLNANRRLGADCLPVADAGADSFRERYLQLSSADGWLRPRFAGAPPASRPGCLRTAAGFSCSCPSGGPAALVRPLGDGPFPAFRVEVLTGGRPGTLRVVSTGCNTARPPCVDAGAGRADATARVEVELGLLGALRVPPTALLTAGGRVDASAATFSGTGVSILAGGPVTGAGPRVRIDATLAARPEDRAFAAAFGLDKPRWKAQPVVTRVTCHSDCAAALAAAAADRGAGAMVWVEGDLDLHGPVVLGSAARPVLVVVEGEARLHGGVEIFGALRAAKVAWNGAGPGAGAAIHGALLAEGDYGGDAAVAFSDDATVRATLTRFAGSFARIGGSWRDF